MPGLFIYCKVFMFHMRINLYAPSLRQLNVKKGLENPHWLCSLTSNNGTSSTTGSRMYKIVWFFSFAI